MCVLAAAVTQVISLELNFGSIIFFLTFFFTSQYFLCIISWSCS